MNAQSEIHNRLAGEIVASIVRPVIESGGSVGEIMVLTESVILGVLLAHTRIGGDVKVFEHMIANIRRRLAEIDLKDIQVAGEA